MQSPKAGAAPIIIIKKKGHHDGHHGGAWKVAYADFVTALMALFIVLWLLNSSEKMKKAVGGYFQDPSGNGKMVGSTNAGTGDALSVQPDDMKSLKEKIQKAMAKDVQRFDNLKDQVQVVVTEEGLRIELIEKEGGTFFESGRSKPTESGGQILAALAEQIASLPNRIVIEGHTDSKPFADGGDYSNWELSSDRANAARRLLQGKGVRQDQIMQVRGIADQQLRKPDSPEDPSNRRVSIIVKFQNAKPGADEKAEAGKEGKGASHGEQKAEGNKEGAKAEAEKHEAPKAEPPKAEPPKAEPNKAQEQSKPSPVKHGA